MKIDTIIMQFSFGTISYLMDKSVMTAREHDCKVHFEFNGVNIIVTKNTDIDASIKTIFDNIGSGKTLEL